MKQCYVAPSSDAARQAAEELARRWDLPVATDDQPPGLRLWVDADGVRLGDSRPDTPGPIAVDFLEPAFLRRLAAAGAAREGLLRAVGAKRGARPEVLDATAGLGQDAAVLAASGCTVTLVERSAVVAALLEDGLRRAGEDPRTSAAIARMTLAFDDSDRYLAALSPDKGPEVVYLDPMYAPRRGGGRSGKSMQHLQALLGHDTDPSALLRVALATARRRVVVKRQRRADALDGLPPDFNVAGNSTRFDIYLVTNLSTSKR